MVFGFGWVSFFLLFGLVGVRFARYRFGLFFGSWGVSFVVFLEVFVGSV